MSVASDEVGDGDRRRSVWGGLAVVTVLTAWLWPIGLGGAMPVGGDVTQFTIGLMAFLADSLRHLSLPIWNDLWGYGFPGIGESQIGAFYPPHWLFYGLLPLEMAYTVSLVLHTFWAGLGAQWAARRFGVSPSGAVLAGLTWGMSGFFLVHLPHQWAQTTGSWMPWVWGLGWMVARGEGKRTTPWLLAAALALQMLPGHFQLAFITQVGLLVLVLAAGPRRSLILLSLSFLMAGLLAMLQLAPTWRLAALADSDRDFEYLGTFATTPFHIASYVVPGLFHRSPLWRSIVWDPFHAIPEESLGYVGLVPLFLAVGVVLRKVPRDSAVRALGLVALMTLLLSWGPYVPGFAWLIKLPGFSFFRAPARWSVATDLALALLAGMGWDAVKTWANPARIVRVWCLLALVVPLLAVGTLEGALAATARPGIPGLVRAADQVLGLAPWSRPVRLSGLMDAARRPQGEVRERAGLARIGRAKVPPEGLRWDRERLATYVDELAPTAAVWSGLVVVGLLAAFARTRRLVPWSLCLLTCADLLMTARLRMVETMPLQSLMKASPVLTKLAGLPRGTRVLDEARNLPMVAGLAPISAYRTLDLPRPRLAEIAMRTGELKALDFVGAQVGPALSDAPGERVDDPVLAGWLYGSAWVAGEGAAFRSFAVRTRPDPPPRCWLLPEGVSPRMNEDPDAIRSVLPNATPLTLEAADPQHRKVDLDARGAEAIVLAVQYEPAWSATWEGEGPQGKRPAELVMAWGGWMAARVPGPGRWTLRLDYECPELYAGMIVSAAAWVVWFACYSLAVVRDRREKGPSS